MPMKGRCTEGTGPNGEYTIDVTATNDVSYHYTFLEEEDRGGCFDAGNPYLADYFRSYGRCVVVIDQRVYDIYGDQMRAYFKHHGMGIEVLPLGIDEEQKSLKTVEECMVFFADVGLMRRETPLVCGGGLITDIIGTACSLYRRSTSYVRLPTTLIGLIDASVAIKVGGNLAGKHKNRIGAFHPHSGVILDFNFLRTLPEEHVRNGVAELIKISTVEERKAFELIERHCEDLIKYKFGYADGAPAGLRAAGREIAHRCVLRMLQLECPNLHEHDQRRAIAFGHTWSPCYELSRSPPLHHGHAISVDMCFSMTWAAKEGWVTEELRDRVHSVFRRCQLSLHHPWFTAEKLHYGTTTILVRRDGDLYAAIPDNQIGKCRYIMCGTFETGRKGLDASLEAGLEAHSELITSKYPNGGIGSDPFITIGAARESTHCCTSKLELGTWAERLEELFDEIGESQSFCTVREKVEGIRRWWDNSTTYMQKTSTPLGAAVQEVLRAQEKERPFPAGMDENWALDVQSAQTLDFFAALKSQSWSGSESVAWDLGTLTGISAAVLSQHFEKVVTIERMDSLAEFARRHLKNNVEVVRGEINEWLNEQGRRGEQADLIFMDLDKTLYEPIYDTVKEHNLLKPGGLLLCDNVLYRGLTAQLEAGEDISGLVSDKTRANAEALARFNAAVRADVEAGTHRGLMMPVRDGMLAVARPIRRYPEFYFEEVKATANANNPASS